MTYKPDEQEREAVSKLAAPQRYSYLIKRCADSAEVWGLSDESGCVSAVGDEGTTFFPVWPHADLARVCAVEAIELYEWIEDWLPELESNEQMVPAFPLPSGGAIPVEPARMRRDLSEESEQYEESRPAPSMASNAVALESGRRYRASTRRSGTGTASSGSPTGSRSGPAGRRATGLDEWMNDWLPELEADNRGVSVFPLPNGDAVPVEPERLRRDLETEAQLHGDEPG